MVSREPVRLTKLLSKKSDGKRESESNKALGIPQKLVFIFHSPILFSAYPISRTKFSSSPGFKTKNKKTKKQRKKEK